MIPWALIVLLLPEQLTPPSQLQQFAQLIIVKVLGIAGIPAVMASNVIEAVIGTEARQFLEDLDTGEVMDVAGGRLRHVRIL